MSELDQYTRRANFPYLHGVIIAANAVADGVVVIDGPDCSFFSTEHVATKHDLQSTMIDVAGNHRIVHTGLHTDYTILGHGARVTQVLERVLAEGPPGPIFVSAWVMASLVGVEYESIAKDLEPRGGKRLIVLPGRGSEMDWLDAYGHSLQCLARRFPIPRPNPDARRVAVIGYMMDRNEHDHRANVAELRRLLEALDLEVSTVWLDGSPASALRRVSEAGTIFALPHGRDAADAMGRRIKATVVDLPLPFGLEATDDFLRRAAAATGDAARAEAVIEREREDVARRVGWLVTRKLLFRTVGFWGDPNLFAGFAAISESVGLEVRALVASSRERPLAPVRGGPEPALPVSPSWQPREGTLRPEDYADDEIDLLVSNQLGLTLSERNGRSLEFGYPSHDYHCAHDAPFLGYRGYVCFIDRVANALPSAAVLSRDTAARGPSSTR